MEILSKWDMDKSLKDITTDNASDTCAAMSIVNDILNSGNNACRTVDELHLRCIAHVVNLAVKDCLSIVHQNITAIRTLLSAIRSPVNPRDMYENIQNQLAHIVPLPSLNLEKMDVDIFNDTKCPQS